MFRWLLLPLLVLGCDTGNAATSPATPTRVILFIGDGMGASYWTAGRFATDKLNVAQFPVGGLVDTRSSNHKVTDSAAGATAYASGIRTYNGAIGVAPDSTPVETVLEIAEAQGMATGLVATSTITHATPAAFAAHVVSRRMEGEIARQMAHQDIDVLLGGGRSFFDGTGNDADDLLPGLNRYTEVASDSALAGLDVAHIDHLLGLFAPGGMPPAADRSPTLAAMTDAALAVVDRDPDGFFLMVEGSQPDWRGHENAPLEQVTAEVLDFDAAIGRGLAYRDRHPETLIIVIADHETGGLAIGADENEQVTGRYVTDYHTAQMIPVFAIGPGAERFGGMHDNFRIGQMLMEAVRDGPVAGGR